MRMTRSQWDALVEHAREEAPNECCGWLRARGGAVDEVFRAANERNSPYGYSLDAATLYAAYQAEEAGADIGVYHSHPRSSAEPSQTDINLATYPHWTYLIVSLENDPVVRAWRIRDGKVEEEEIVVDGRVPVVRLGVPAHRAVLRGLRDPVDATGGGSARG